jgi:hypothetical protein
MRSVFHLLSFMIAMLSAAPSHAGPDDTMEFFEATNGGNCATCRWIVAEGVITEDSAQEFEAFLESSAATDHRGVAVHLNSPGGSLLGGVLLGGAIRRAQMNTVVSAAPVEEVLEGGVRLVGPSAAAGAQCASACVFAFAGGVSRFASRATPPDQVGFQEIGRLGVHQFYDAGTLLEPTALLMDAEDRISDQQIIALLLRYLSAMDVSAELLQIASATDPRDMHYLGEEELSRTRIDNRMVREVGLKGYANGVAIAEVTFSRRDADYRHELYCDGGAMHMLTSIAWRGEYDLEGHREWSLFDGISLADGGRVELLGETFSEDLDGGTTGQLRFRFTDALNGLVGRTDFFFQDGSSRYASDAAASMSFALPEGFDGLHLLPRTCM